MDENRDMLGSEGDRTVADIAQERWGVRPPAAIARFDLLGWTYEQPVDTPCPRCKGVLQTIRKPYESAGKLYRYIAFVCPQCPATFTLADLGLKTHADLCRPPKKASSSANSASAEPIAAPAEPTGDTTVAGVTCSLWGVRPQPAVPRYTLPGWRYLRQTDIPCPGCQGLLQGLYRVYYEQGQARVQAAVVCPACNRRTFSSAVCHCVASQLWRASSGPFTTCSCPATWVSAWPWRPTCPLRFWR